MQIGVGTEPTARRRAPSRGRRAAAAGAAVLLVAVGAGAAWLATRGRPAASGAPAVAVALSPVTSGPLSSQEQEIGTVQDTDSFNVVNQAQGVVTGLPALGRIVAQGQALYAVNGDPVILLYGTTPVYRSLSTGMQGTDVAELNADLVALGFAPASAFPEGGLVFSQATATALEALQSHVGQPSTGQLALGQAIFLPKAVQVSSVTPSLGESVGPGQTVIQATSTTLEIVVQLDATQESQVHKGDAAAITLPDGSTTPGRVSYVADVATAPSSTSNGGGGGSSNPTVEVDIAPKDPSALAALSNAQLDVAITTASVPNALSVPVTALLAQPNGSYDVEVAARGGTTHLVPVRLGIFDDALGSVQVIGPGLHAGQQVVAAGT